jgi:DNA (cytosine-5)-methyltransferase 1
MAAADTDLVRYRKLLLDRGVAAEITTSAAPKIFAELQRSLDEATWNLVNAGHFSRQTSELLILPPENEVLLLVSTALRDAVTGGRLSGVAAVAAATAAGIFGPVEPTSRTTAVGVGKRGSPRIWLEGKWLTRSRFKSGTRLDILVDGDKRCVTVEVNPEGSRVVSEHRGVPVIDITRADLAKVLGSAERVIVSTTKGKIEIRPEERSALVGERKAKSSNMLEGSVFSGAGFLTLAAEQAGYTSTFAVEIDQTAADVFSLNHPSSLLHRADVKDVVVLAQRELERGSKPVLPRVGLLTGGIPCSPYSRFGKTNTQYSPGEAKDDELVAMTHWFLNVVQLTHPLNIVVEQVDRYLLSTAWGILKFVLLGLGYHVQSRVIDPTELGLVAGRTRAVIVATTEPTPGLLESVVNRRHRRRFVADLLHVPAAVSDLPATQGGWFTAGQASGPGNYLPKLWQRDSFKPSFIDKTSTRITAIPASYGKVAPTGPFVRHPKKPDTWRMLTITELKRLHGVPEKYELTGNYLQDAALIGQGVVVDVFREVMKALPTGSRSRTRNPGPVEEDMAEVLLGGV